MAQPVLQRTFAAGELAPVLHARADQARYASGLATCRNFLVQREGGVSNRGGLRFINAAKTNDAGTRLVRYFGSVSGESCLLEMGTGYLRFTQNGAAVEVSSVPAWTSGAYVPGDLVVRSGVNYYCITAHTNHGPPNATYWYALTGDIYEIPTPFDIADDLPDWNQSGNVITFTHPGLPPYELIFETLTRWVLRAIVTEPGIAAPTALWGSRNTPGTLITSYKVTAAKADTYEESDASSVVTIVSHDTLSPTSPNAIGWAAVAGAAEHYVYADRYANGTYGYVGTATGTNSFRDTGVAPDLAMTPPVARSPFASAGDYPSQSANYQQRRFFANTDNDPDAVWGSRIGFQSNFGISSPLQDDDSVTFRLAGNNHHPIRHMLALKAGLVLLTDGGEWTMTGGGGVATPITPSSISADQETYVGGAANVRPCIVGDSIIYVQARGSVLRYIQYSLQVQGLAGADLSIWASHFFKRKTVLAMDYQQVPDSVVWAVRNDGTLLGMTYVPEQEVAGWHRHDTLHGVFEDVCVVPEDDEDALYCLVARTIGGGTVRYIERMERRDAREGYFDEDSFFVDSGLSYTGAPADLFGGLEHLEGQVVAVLADGNVIYDGDPDGAEAANYTVTDGEIQLPDAYGEVHIGLRIVAEIETLNLDVQGSDVRARQKLVSSVKILVESSGRVFQAGPDADHLVEYEPPAWADEPPCTGDYDLSIDADWNSNGRVLIRQAHPLPLTILGVVPNVDLGGT